MRDPVVAGMFYEEKEEALKKQIEECFESKFGPGRIKGKQEGDLLGAIVPHAGYPFSGPCAAWSYKEIAESELPDVFVILGTSHSGHGSCISDEDWKTPLGTVKIDSGFVEELIANSELKVNNESHYQEHSIEVQVPFLQSVFKDKADELKIVPIMISHGEDYAAVAKALQKTIATRKCCVIASSDFTHYGMNYGFVPFTENIKENLYKLDKEAIDRILDLDAKGFLDYVGESGATVCGAYPIACLVELIRLINGKASLLKYYTSGDIVGDYSNSVGYVSIVFRR